MAILDEPMSADALITGYWLSVAGALAWPLLQLLALANARRTWQFVAALLPIALIAFWLIDAFLGAWAMNLFVPGLPVALVPVNLWLIGVILAGALTARGEASDARRGD